MKSHNNTMVKKKKSDEDQKDENIYPALPAWEISCYLAVHIGIVLFICYCVYKASNDYDGLLNLYDFEPGWSIIGREKDISNFEWTFFYKYFWTIWPWYVGHVALSKLALWNFNEYKKTALTLYSLMTLMFVLGWRVICLFLAHCIVMYAASFLQSVAFVWIISLGLLSTLNFEPFVSWMKLLNTDDEQGSFIYLLMFTLAFAQLRYTSFCLEKVKYYSEELVDKGHHLETEGEKNERDNVQANIILQYSWTDLLFYVFYFPLFFTGPMMSYKMFSSQFLKPPRSWTRTRVSSLCFGFARVIFWALVNEVVLHYFYFNALQHSSATMRRVDLWTLAGVGYCSGQFFMTKYTVMFGLPSHIARLDHLEPPKGPKCVAYIYLYSDMWKYFDRGMYHFIKRYIYIPLGGSRVSVLRQCLGAVMCFLFVYFWHGLEYYVFIWTLFNLVGIGLEALGAFLSKQPALKAFEVQFLSPASVRRMHALITVPIFVMSAFTAFCFFGGSAVGYTYYERFVYKGSPEKLLVVISLLYCCIQVGIEVKRHECSNQQIKKG